MTDLKTDGPKGVSSKDFNESKLSHLKVDYIFSHAQRDNLIELLDVPINPYRSPREFLERIDHMAYEETPEFLIDLCSSLRATAPIEKPFYYIKNCPIDMEVPVLGFEDQLSEKYRKKTTFVAEAFLALFTKLMGTHIVSYRTANNGDLFHDIHPMRKLAHTPSQKTVDSIKFHADIPNNKVRPDWVYLLSMRNSPKNKVYTVVLKLKDVFDRLGSTDFELLKKPIFFSPRDTIHVYGGQEAGFTPYKPLLISERGREYLAFFDGNTSSNETEGINLLKKLSQIFYGLGQDVFLERNDFLAMSNNTAMHARRVDEVTDIEEHHNRWLLKTWNVDDISEHTHNFIPGKVNMSDE